MEIRSDYISFKPISMNTAPIQKPTLKFNNVLTADTFIKSSPNFCGTSNGNFLKDLEGIRDPYSGVVILTSKQMGRIQKELPKQKNIRQRVRYLGKYEKSMLPVEKSVYRLFTQEAKKNKFTNFSRILKSHKENSMKHLIQEQNHIFDEIEASTENISPIHRDKVINELSEARERVLLPNDDMHKFKRKKFISRLAAIHHNEILDKIEEKMLEAPIDYEKLEKISNARFALNNFIYDTNLKGKTPIDMVRELQQQYIPETLNEKNEIEPLIDIANKLPTSNTSVNAFVVKYWDRSEKEIGERLLNQSVGTIEHIHADSLGGENEAANFMLATRLRNEERGNMPLSEFIKLHPNIPKYCQQYMNDIINAAHRGKIPNQEWYPYLLKNTMQKEAGINLDISKYRITPKRAFKTLPPKLRTKYPEYSAFIPDSTEPLNNRR